MPDWNPEANELFLQALEIAAPEDRQRFLDEVCGGNPDLRARVDRLLLAGAEAGSFLERPLEAPELTTAHVPSTAEEPTVPPASLGTIVGRYKLLEVIGEGGMGTVWLAEQTEPVRRKVALKVIKPGMDSKQVLARFEAERQALALMDHPNIAKVLDGGATADGRPYFVMELVKGVPITKYCDDHRMPPRQRLELFLAVCQAVQHAHQKGIIHRDIKPSNVLVAPYDGRPVPKVIDFGIAKATGQPLTEKTLFTGLGAVVGTPEYMSPEQAELNNQDIDTRSDIYSLGVLLYELLTGSTPITRKRLKEAALLEVLRLVREEEAQKPSTRLSDSKDSLPSISAQRQTEPAKLTKLVRGELDWIVMKALEKDRTRRYESANGFAADVGRYLADEAVEACPPSAAYRFWKFSRRNRGRLAVAGLVVFFLTVLAGGAGWAAKDRADRAQEAGRQEGARRAALEADIGRNLDEARAFCRADRLPEASVAVDQARALFGRGGGSEELGVRVSGVRADVDMAIRLEAVRLEQAAVKGNTFDTGSAGWRYRDAFRDYALDLVALDADAVVERIRASAIEGQLLAALDDWLATGSSPDGRLLAVLGRADADPWRGRFRAAYGQSDREALKDLARNPAVLAQPPATVKRLGTMLVGLGERPLAVDVLRSAQQQHPNDFWINHSLALYLDQMMPSRVGEAVGYYRAALALRPDSPGVHLNLGFALYGQGDRPGAIAEYQKAIALKPEYAEAHWYLGNALCAQGDRPGAIAEYQKAIALKPEYAEAHNNLGRALHDQGDRPGAIAAYREAIRIKPEHAAAHSNLGIALYDQGDLPGAVAEYQKAIALKPEFAEAHSNLGNALYAQGDRPGAIAEYQKAIALKPEYTEAHYNLGNALRDQGDQPGAVAEYKKTVALKPDLAEAHCNLGHALQCQGEFQTALTALRRGHELGSRNPRWNYPSAEWVRQCERLVQLDGQLPDFRDGKTTPTGSAERIELARLCSVKRLYGAATRFYEEAFTDSVDAASQFLVANRYNAACVGAQAGCGKGKDADQLTDKDRARLRRQALDWLRADLEATRGLLDKQANQASSAAGVVKVLHNWQVDSDLAGVRGPEALAMLPEAEQQPWHKLWADVADTLARAQVKTVPEKKPVVK